MTTIEEAAAKIAAAGPCSPRLARDPVNQATVNTWIEAIGDANPVYRDPYFAASSVHKGLVAPPAMAQVWTMPGLRGARAGDDPMGAIITVLDEAGYSSIVATNCEQTYHRYLRPGERVAVTTELEGVAGPKRTALGEGWFVTTHMRWTVDGELVGEMLFRVLKYRPAAPEPPAPVLRPVISRDTEFFWAGLRAGELRIQRWGDTLRHPPGPMPPDGALDTTPDYLVASGRGTVYSYVVHHHPPVPGKRLPFVVALVELEEGVRVIGELLDAAPDEVRIGLPVVAAFVRVDDDLTLPAWKPLVSGEAGSNRPGHSRAVSELPPLRIDASTTFVVSTALATRDFQDVHHDRDAAVARGSQDIFLNILTDTGLVQRFVSEWAGPEAIIRSVKIRLGVPCYAGDTLTFTGRVLARDGAEVEVAVSATGKLGEHVTGTVALTLPAGAS